MKCFAQFFLPGCAAPMPDEYEEFHSISDAKRALLHKHEDASRYDDGDSEMLVFLGAPEGDYPCDTYPDRCFKIGPRGGVTQLSV